MRLFGLTLALLASSLGARAESVEDRMTALEQQVKTLQAALRNQSGVATMADTESVDEVSKTADENKHK